MRAAVIIGAGFSKNSGIPVQSEIPEFILCAKPEHELDLAAIKVLYRFFEQVYGYRMNHENSVFPELNDIFKSLDTAISSGHHLGIGYSPDHLKVIRKVLMYRLYSLLEESFFVNPMVLRFFHALQRNYESIDYIVLNWDTVLEKYLMSDEMKLGIDYCNQGGIYGKVLEKQYKNRQKVIKIHGSVNWIYCRNCRSLFYDMENRIKPMKKAGFFIEDFQLFECLRNIGEKQQYMADIGCTQCGALVASHISSPEYRKSFRMNSFADLWREAENSLALADEWVFVGYSLPKADEDFKHMLKISELKFEHQRMEKLKIHIIHLQDGETIRKFRSFFGGKIHKDYSGGIEEYVHSNPDSGWR